MTLFEFTIIASGLDPLAADFEDRFVNAGCDDATLSFHKGVIVLDFDRESDDFEGAVESAIADVAATPAYVERIEPDNLVNLSDIAKRAGLTRAAIHNYATGERADNFPTPFARVMTDSAVWDWAEVSLWLLRRGQIDTAVHAQAVYIRDTNMRLYSERVARAERVKAVA